MHDLLKALRFYADPNNYDTAGAPGVRTNHSSGIGHDWVDDHGDRARAALAAAPAALWVVGSECSTLSPRFAVIGVASTLEGAEARARMHAKWIGTSLDTAQGNADSRRHDPHYRMLTLGRAVWMGRHTFTYTAERHAIVAEGVEHATDTKG